MFAPTASLRRLVLALILSGAYLLAAAPPARAAAPSPLEELQAMLANEALSSYRQKAYDQTIVTCERALTRLDVLGDASPDAMQLRARFVLLAAGSHDFLRHSQQAVALYETYLRISEGVAAEDANRANARARLAALRAFLILRVTPVDAKVTIDGRITPVPADGRVLVTPGHHLVHVQLLGYNSVDRAVELAGGAEVEIAVALLPLEVPTVAPSARAIGAWVAAGVGVAGAVTGIVGVVMAAGKRARIEDAADADGVIAEETMTRREALALESDANTLSTVGLAGFIVAGVGAVTATTLLLLPDPTSPTVRADAGVTGFRVAPVERGAMLGWGTRF